MPHLLVINFFPAFTPASSGGELRLGKLYRALSKTHQITMLTSTDFGARYEEIEHTNSLRELRFPKDELWRQSYAGLERLGVQGDLSGLAFSLAVSEPSCALRSTARQLAATADLVVHEFPYSEPIFNDGCPVKEIYNSHNFEASLLSSIATGDGFDAALIKLIRLEGNLVARASLVYATSQDDAEKFRLFYGAPAEKILVCPNGFDDEELLPIAEARKLKPGEASGRRKLMFFGSGHRPNVEAAEFICSIAPAFDDCDVLLAGGVCSAFSGRELPPNIVLTGGFDAAGKTRLLSEADVFLNPVILGSGTSLKALEALGSAVPMVSTPEGARGLELIPGAHCEIAPRSEFVPAVRRLLDDQSYARNLAAAGLSAARAAYSWSNIAQSLSDTMFGEVRARVPERPLVLALNDYAVLEPGSGGIARVRALMGHIECDVVLMSFGAIFEARLILPHVLHVTIPKTSTHRAFEEALNDGQPMSVNDAAASLFCASNRVFCDIISTVARRAHAVIFEHPYMAPLLDVIHKPAPQIPVVYSAHNVETTHKVDILRGHSSQKLLVEFITGLERRLIERASLILCCTESDASFFRTFGSDVIVVPNGCAIPELPDAAAKHAAGEKAGSARVGFMGSSHGPNLEAALFILAEMVPACPDMTFEFIGSVCGALPRPLPENVVCHGLVTEHTKTALLASWSVALNPIESGGGSSLKLPDYLAHGTATISTQAGARGFAIVENQAAVVTSRKNFVSTLKDLLAQPAELAALRMRARRYAIDNLSWNAITHEYRGALGRILRPVPVSPRLPRLLVITYRYTEPSLGGAEEYLVEVLKRLRPRFEIIDLAAVDVEQITNHHHFSCKISAPPGGSARRVAELFDRSFYFASEEPPEDTLFTKCRDLEREWSKEEIALLAPFVTHLAAPKRLRLLSGVYGPENHGSHVRRWTSAKFSFLIPAHTHIFRMAGYASTEKTLRLTLSEVRADGAMVQRAVHSQIIPVNFSVDLAIPVRDRDRPLILQCEVDEHHSPGDHRPFGVLLEVASALVDDARGQIHDNQMVALSLSTADLSELLDEELRVEQFDDWIASLHRTAAERSPVMEAEFASVRGPHTPALWAWLADHAKDYDSILVQGIPFDVIPSAVETLAALPSRPRIVTLPHFHGDDRFYYWRRYLDSFAAADSTLLFSPAIAQNLGGGDKFRVVPGGGVTLDEQSDGRAELQFQAVHASRTPYFLVLGRKTASKGYQQVIDAQQRLRRSGVEVELVMIGPDEDGRAVNGEGVHYLGRQPREIVRGALRGCLGLISMSRSESFGIVLCEAWLFSKPVIANRACYSFRELVRHGETGLLVTGDDELMEAMAALAADDNRRTQIGLAGFEDVVERYSWQAVAMACFSALTVPA